MEGVKTEMEGKIVINRVEGPVKPYEIFKYLKKNVEDWKMKPVLWDFDKADFRDVNTDIWQEMVQMIEPLTHLKAGEKTAIFASRDLPFGMMRMFDLLAQAFKFKIKLHTFRSMEDAKKWLLKGKG